MSLDEWIPELKRKREIERKKRQPSYKLPVGHVSVYFREGEGFTIRYDARTYDYGSRMEDLMTNLSILSKIWSKLIQLNLSPRYLGKAYDDDLYATVIDVINNKREGWMEMEIDGFKVKVSKHEVGTILVDMSRFSSVVPYDVIPEMNKRGIYFENPMIQYQLALEKIKRLKANQKTTKETKEYRCELCGKATTELHELRTGQYREYFPNKWVCWDCYLRENKKFYEKYGRCSECHTRVKLGKWPNFKCENGHIINVNFIEIDAERLLDDVYGKIPVEDYKKLHDRLVGSDTHG